MSSALRENSVGRCPSAGLAHKWRRGCTAGERPSPRPSAPAETGESEDEVTEETRTPVEAKELANLERQYEQAERAERAERARKELEARTARQQAELEEKVRPIRERFADLLDQDERLADAREEVAAAVAFYAEAQRQRGEELVELYNEAIGLGLPDPSVTGAFEIRAAQTVALREAAALENVASELGGERRWQPHHLFPPQSNPYDLPYDQAKMYAGREHRRQRLLILMAGMSADVRDRAETLTRLRKNV